MSNEKLSELQEELDALWRAKRTVTIEDVESALVAEWDYKLGEKTTVVLLKLKSGFEVLGHSGCVDPASYNHEVGKKYARERALSKVWELEGYLLQSKLSLETH